MVAAAAAAGLLVELEALAHTVVLRLAQMAARMAVVAAMAVFKRFAVLAVEIHFRPELAVTVPEGL